MPRGSTAAAAAAGADPDRERTRAKTLNSPPSSQVQMPAHVDAAQGNSGSYASGGASGKPASGHGFAHAMASLRMPVRENSVDPAATQGPARPAAGGESGKAKPAVTSGGKRSDGRNGKDLPLTALLLPLLQQLQARNQPTKSEASATAVSDAAKAKSVSASGTSRLSAADLNQILQLVDGKAGAARSGESAQSWQAALDRLLTAGAGAHAPANSTPTALPLATALSAQGGAEPASAAGAGAQAAQTPLSASSAPPLALGDPGFANALGSRVSWLAGTPGSHFAQLQLHPQQLGPMLVHVKVHGHQTEILFQTQHAVVTQTLEASLPRLREMLTQGGQQVSVNIQQQPGGGSGQPGQGQQQTPQWTMPAGWGSLASPVGEIGDLGGTSSLARWYSLRNGMVDTYV